MAAYGLRTHIWNNRLKSLLLLAGFPLLLLLICYAFALIIVAFEDPDIGQGFADALSLTPALIPLALAGSAIWFLIAWFANQKIVALATGAKGIDRKTDARLYNLLENLCISRGITMPRLDIIETPVLNAFASGIRKSQYTITVTRGLLDTLDDAELEAVLGHELTHIRNRDVELLVIAAVFVGIISLAADILIRSPRAILMSTGRSSSRSNSKGGGGGAIVLILVAIGIFILARLLATALRLAMSRKREYLADAGAVELTKNPDAMIGALDKISGRSKLEAPVQVQAMFIDYPARAGFLELFATHPPIEKRIDALVRFAGGRRPPPAPPPLPEPPAAPLPEIGSNDSAAPWGNATGGEAATPADGPNPWGPRI